MRRFLSLALLIVLGTGSASATTLDVPASYTTIAAGLAAAVSGDTVLVACGTYNESNLTMKSGVILRSATGLSDCATINAGAGSYRVITCSGLASGTIIEGFTLTGGRGSTGAGVSCTGSSVLFKQCRFTGNTSSGGGGGAVAITSDNPVFSSCAFVSNSATGTGGNGNGGAAYITGGAPSFTGCIFSTNTAANSTYGGGAVYCSGTTAVFTDCTMDNNTAPNSGAMYVASAITLERCTFTNNRATNGAGGAIRFASAGIVMADSCAFSSSTATTNAGALDVAGTTLNLSHCTLSLNSAATGGGAAYVRSSASVTMTDCTVNDNAATGSTATGGALWVASAVLNMDRCSLDQNHISTTGSFAGALYMSSAGASSADSCSFYHNAAGRGGAVYVTAGSPTFSNCTFSTNTASASSQYGGAAYCTGSTTAAFVNCSMISNTAHYAGGLYADAGIQVNGCTFSYNSATGSHGGGAYFTANAGSVVVTASTFDHNTTGSSASGGGAYCNGGTDFSGCQVIANSAGYGGGLYLATGTYTHSVSGSTLSGNTASSSGGGAYGGSFSNCTFSQNTAGSSGGGVIYGTVTGCTFSGNHGARGGAAGYSDVTGGSSFIENTASASGGALYYYFEYSSTTPIYVSNSVFYRNSAPSGGGIYQADWPGVRPLSVSGCTFCENHASYGSAVSGYAGSSSYALTISNTIMAFGNCSPISTIYNYVTLSCSNIYGHVGGDWVGTLASQLPLRNNMEADPQFCDRAAGDLHLAATSPCLNPPACGLLGPLGQGCDTPAPGRLWLVPSQVPTIQAAIDSSWAGDTVLVANGFAGGAASITKSGITLLGDAERPDSIWTSGIAVTAAKGTTVRMFSVGSGGLSWSGGATGTVADCAFVRKAGAPTSSVISITGGSVALDRATVAYNQGKPIVVSGASTSVTISNSIVAFNENPGVECTGGTVTVGCSDIYGNLGGDWVGCIAGQGSLNNNLTADPLFCDVSGQDFHLAAGSPCLLAPGCGVLGAFGEGCSDPLPLRIWHVPTEAPTIAAALDSSWTGETIIVEPGTYHEHGLNLKSGITLQSESGLPDSVTIDADGAGVGLLNDGRRYSTIKGFRFTDAPSGSWSSGLAGVYLKNGEGIAIEDCAFILNDGYGLYLEDGTGHTVTRCTVALNGSDGVFVRSGSPTLDRTVIAFNEGAAVGWYQTAPTPSLTCSDLYGNEGGDWTGCVAGQDAGSGNSSSNPMFCEPAVGDARLAALSPCLDAPGCGRLGAYGQGCDAPAPGRVWDVPLEVPTIQSAIDSSLVGDTVAVACGTYEEHGIRLKPRVVLKSATGAADCAVIDAEYLGCVLDATNAKDARIEGLTLIRGEASFGAGLYCQGSAGLALEECALYGNRGSQGPGVYCDSASPISLARCTFAWNEADDSGAGIWTQASVTAQNSIIAFNDGGEAVRCDGSGTATLTCTDVYGNAGGNWVGCIAGQEAGGGNFSANPLFCHVGAIDLHLAEGSPCLDAAGCGLVGALGQGCSSPIFSRVWHVPSEVLTIQAAIDSAYAQDTVLVACGTYTWTGEGSGDTNGMIRMKNRITLLSETGEPDCVTINAEDQGRVIYCGGLGSLTTVKGFTITGGLANEGGGVYHLDDATRVLNCRIHDNYAGRGGGAYLAESTPEYSDCEFTSNRGDGGGGALSCTDSSPFLVPGAQFLGCTFTGNRTSSSSSGAVAELFGFGGTFSHCLMAAQGYGISVVYFGDASGATEPSCGIENTVIAFNQESAAIRGLNATAPTLSCCDIYGNQENWGSYISSQLGLRGNIQLDPMFCDRVGLDFRLAAESPCLNPAGCGLMGPNGVGECGLRITAIRDIVPDQGGQVRVRWRRAYMDAPGLGTTISNYALWRRIDDESGKAGSPTWKTGSLTGETRDLMSMPPGDWECVMTVPASGESSYATVSPTLCDSTIAEGQCYSVFFVRAYTPNPFFFYDAAPDSGYSVDNLVPSPPTDLRFDSPGILAWDSSPDPDFDYFTVYGSTQASLGDSAVVIAYTSDPTQSVAGQLHAYYHVTATDFSGNEGPAATIQGTNPAGVGDVGLPKMFSLYANAPNPFSQWTVIRLDLPEARPVRLCVYGVDGRLVCRLVDARLQAGSHRVQWRAIDDHGRPVPSGIYFCRVVAGSFSSTKRMALAR